MPAAPPVKDAIALIEDARPDQRLQTRYPIRLDLEYSLLINGLVKRTGSGRTLNLSSAGVFFETNGPLLEHREIKLVMDWPCLLNGICHLKLIVRGRVVRSDRTGTAVRMKSYEFHTGKRPSHAVKPK